MAMKNITDKQVVEAYLQYQKDKSLWPYQILQKQTGQPEKVCFKCCERAEKRGFIDYGTSLRSGWATDKGIQLL